MTTITDTINTAVPEARGSYANYVNRAAEALQAREDTIKENLRAYAVDKGLSNGEVDTLFIEVGLDEPAPEPAPEPVAAQSEGDLPAWAQSLVDSVKSLSQKVDSLTGSRR